MKNTLTLWSLIYTLLFCSCVYNSSEDSSETTLKKEIPILAWHSIPFGEHINLERYKELKEAGFTMSFSFTYGLNEAIKVLDLCEKVGLKSILMCSALSTEPEATVAKVKDHPALAGYFLRDEPQEADFDELATWAKRIIAADSTHFSYLNLLPITAVGEDRYRHHVRTFAEIVPLQVLSFDIYPVRSYKQVLAYADGKVDTMTRVTLHPLFYKNLQIFSEEAKRAGKPFWAFSLATPHSLNPMDTTVYPQPEKSHIRLQMYSNLAYGAQALQYFTYWTPTGATFDFHQGPITENAKRSVVYDYIQEINQELQARAFVFVDSEVLSVSHTGKVLPAATEPLTQLPDAIKEFQTEGSAVISHLKNGKSHYWMIVNKNMENTMKFTVTLDDGVQRVRKDGKIQSASLYDSIYYVEPGGAEIFTWSE